MDEHSQDTDQKQTILIIDDTVANLRLLTSILSPVYTVRPASSGILAVKSLEFAIPDLILLDIRMPHMDGYEVCSFFKSNHRTHDIPIIFISALDDVSDKIKGFRLGAVDFITKPFHSDEVIARVGTHLSLHRLEKLLKARNRDLDREILERRKVEDQLRLYQVSLEDLVTERTGELKKSEERYRSLVNNLNIGVFRSEPGLTGSWCWVNPAFIRMFGYDSPEDILVHQVSDFFVSPKDLAALQEMIEKSGFLRDFIIGMKKKNNARIWVSMTLQIRKGPDDERVWIDGICEDITEKKENEEEIKTAVRQINRNMEMLTILNDHIRNPLTVISCYCDEMNEEISGKISAQVMVIDDIVDKLDKGWIESDKIRRFLLKHYGIP
jgi:PAS domain S-box-containing protein